MAVIGRRALLKGVAGGVGGYMLGSLVDTVSGDRAGGPLVPPGAATAAAAEEADWFKRPQIYGQLPLAPADARALGLTLNGLWGGYFWDSPIRQGDYLYTSDLEHVDAMHVAGLRTAGVIDSAGAYEPMLARYPLLGDAIETRADGTPAVYTTEATYALMSPGHPAWLDWQIAEGKRIIDAGGDLITLDNCVPVGRALLLGWLAQPGGTAGLSEAMLAGFRAYAAVARPDVATMPTTEICRRIRESEPYLYGLGATKDPLLDQWVAFWKEASYGHMRQLTEALRDYARAQGRTVPIVGNWSLHGSRLGAQGEYTLDVPRYWPLFDMFAAECGYSIAGDDDSLLPMPRQKLLATYKLGWGIKPTPSVFLPSVSTRLMRERLFNLPNFYFIQMAEAYANRQNMVVYAYPGDPSNLDYCRALTPLTTFVTAHTALYEAARTTHADAAVVLFTPERWAAHGGIAQALAESNVQFDTLVPFDGVGLSADRLRPYPTVAVATLEGAGRADIQALNDHVRRGGRVVVFGDEADPDLISHSRVRHAGGDLGSAYLAAYADLTRRRIRGLVLGGAAPRVGLNRDLRKIVATAYTGERLLVVHLVNYDHRMGDDRVGDAVDVVLTVRHPAGVKHRLSGTYSPDAGMVAAVESEVTDAATTVRLPRLQRYAIVVLRPAA